MSADKVTYRERYEFATLYKTDTRGLRRMWRVWVEDDTVRKMYGVVDGKLVENQRVVKANRDQTAYEKAVSTATTDWINSIKKDYTPNTKEGLEMMNRLLVAQKESGGHNINAVSAVSGSRRKKDVKRTQDDTLMVSEVQGGAFIPMKAHVWELDDTEDLTSVKKTVLKYFCQPDPSVKGGFIDTPFYGQPKLDGWRARVLYQLDSDGEPEIAITSNSGKQYRWFSSLRQVYLAWLNRARAAMGEEVFWDTLRDGLDGEMYTKVIFDDEGKPLTNEEHFSSISSICGILRSEPHKWEDQIQHHVFDLADKKGVLKQPERFARLSELFSYIEDAETKSIVQVETERISSVSEVPEYLEDCVEAGYEGCILRAHELLYGGRSRAMRKFKKFIDAEYMVVGCLLDEGVAPEHFVWECVAVVKDTKTGKSVEKSFKAKPMGTRVQKKKLYEERGECIGKYLCVKFQEYSADGIPRFPIGKGFREPGDF